MIKNKKNILFQVTLFFAAVITMKEVAEILNNLFLDFSGAILYIDFLSFYNSDINGLVYAAIGVAIALVIPIFISVYENLKGSHAFSAHFIKSNFKTTDIAYLMFLLLLGVISRNSIFLVSIFLLVLFLLVKRVKTYFKFLYWQRDALVDHVKKMLESSKNEEGRFISLVNQLEKDVSQIIPCEDRYEYEFHNIYFSSENGVSKFDKSILVKIIKKIKNKIIEVEAEHVSGNDSDAPSANDCTKRMFVSIRYDAAARNIGMNISVPISSENTKKHLDKTISEYKEQYKKIFEYKPGIVRPDDLLNDLDGYVLTLIHNGDMKKLEEIITLLRMMLKEEKFASIDIMKKVSLFNHRLFVLGKDVPKNRWMSSLLFDYWESFLTSTIKHPKESFVRYAMSDLANAVDGGFFYTEDLARLDHNITSFYKYNKFDNAFIQNYLKGVIQVSVSLYEKDNKEFSLQLLKFIQYMEQDFSKHKSFLINQYTNDELTAILNSSRQALLMVAFYFSEEKNCLDDSYMSSLYSMVDRKSFFNVLQIIYLNTDDERWNTMNWGDYRFDRHGMGRTRSFCLTTFLRDRSL